MVSGRVVLFRTYNLIMNRTTRSAVIIFGINFYNDCLSGYSLNKGE